MKKSLIGYSSEELLNLLIELKQPKFRASQVHEWIYSKHVAGIDEMSNLPAALRNTLSENFEIIPLKVKAKAKSKDGTIKYILECLDGELIETVYIPSSKRRTVCISTQVGCPVKCVFCASGKSGLVRNLRKDEIAGQIAFIAHEFGMMPTNVVVMGMGEPLLNPNFIDGLKIITGEDFYRLGSRHVTVSTSGIVPGIYKLADEGGSQWNLAVSIHAANDEDRGKIIPSAARFSLNEILDACNYYRKKTGRRITFEYTLVKGENNSQW
ncbi:MAG: 23S rRNA (adenine(2503)-C(2))-methyltransferase RlmN, partial [Lentisphaeria bacterium]